MSTSAETTVNGHSPANHDHILRPRAVKPGNPALLRTQQSDEGLLAVGPGNLNSSGQTRYPISLNPLLNGTDCCSGRSTPVPADAPPSAHTLSSARKQLKAQSRRRLFPTIEYASRVSHFDPNSDYRDFKGFYVLFWIALTIMAITTMLRNIKDTGYPMRVKIWQLFTVKVWELGLADGLMVVTTSLSLPLHRLFRSSLGRKFGIRWATGGMAAQSVYQTLWFSSWVA
jgi:sterol O-acyltransferase